LILLNAKDAAVYPPLLYICRVFLKQIPFPLPEENILAEANKTA